MQFVDKQQRRAARTPLVVLVVLNIMLLTAVATLLLAQATPTAEPRVVTPRGELGADERATIELFRRVWFSSALSGSWTLRRMHMPSAQLPW